MEAAITHTWDTSADACPAWYVRLLPSLTDLAFLLPIAILFHVLNGTKNLLADGDTGWHIRTGEWILQHAAVPDVDLFSFTKPHQAWFAWEWGWDVSFAVIHRFAGLGGVAFTSVAVLCLISALLFRLIRKHCDNDVLAVSITLLCLCGSTIHWLARPHLFGWLFLLMFSHLLFAAENGRTKALFFLPPVMLLWTNFHGSFFVGLVLLATSALGEAFHALFNGLTWRATAKRTQPYLLCGLGCLAASLINPYGWHLHEHVWSYITDAKQLAKVQEFQSIDFHSGTALFFECMLLPGAAAIVWCLRHRQFAAAMNLTLWAHLALVSARNIPIFLFVAAPSVAAMIQEFSSSLDAPVSLNAIRDFFSEVYIELKPIERIERWHLVSLASLLIVAVLFVGKSPGFEPRFNKDSFPEQAIPVLEATNASRVFTYDQWGDYLIYRGHPSQKVFVDGRSDFYGVDFMDRCLHILNARYDWQADLKLFAVDTVLVKTDAPVATLLKQTAGWKVLFDDGFLIVIQNSGFAKGHATVHGDLQRFSTVSHNGRNELGAFNGLQVDGSKSHLNTHERRIL